MEKNNTKLFVLVVLTLLFITTNTFAIGLGIFIPTVSNGTTTLDISYRNDSDLSIEPDISHFGFGFVMDTKVANPGVFNYRLHIGYESVTLDFPKNQDYYIFNYNSWIDHPFSRISIDNTFGFAVLQSKVMRLWLGPQIRLSYMRFNREFEGANFDVNLIGIGIAPVIGANFNIGSVFTLAPELGYRISVFGGTFSSNALSIYLGSNYNEDWTLTTRGFYLKLNIIFRINDYYF